LLSSAHDTDLDRLRSRIGRNIGTDTGTGTAAGGE
jgi:hypothetical protein